jgi:hypothetical protein
MKIAWSLPAGRNPARARDLLSACEGTPAVKYQSPPPGAAAGSWTFDGDTTGGIPTGAELFSGTWVVRAEADAPSKPNALCQVGDSEFLRSRSAPACTAISP